MSTGSLSILPTILYLTTGVLKQLAPRGTINMSPVISTALHCLKVLCTLPLLSRDQKHSASLKQHLQSTLKTVVDFAQPGNVCNTCTGAVRGNSLLVDFI